MRVAVNMEQNIHCLEIHAYSSLLKAFIAQSELLTWGKEELLTEIRKELRIADSEHGEILTRINSDETVKWIREQRKMASHSHAQAYNNANTTGCPSAPIGNSVIRLKAPPSIASYPRKNIPHSQDSLSSIQIPSSMPLSKIGRNVTVLKYNDNLTTVQFVHGNAEPPKEMFNYDAQLSPIGRGSVPKGNCQFVHGSTEPPKEMFNYDAQLPPPGGRESMAKGNCQFVHGNAEPPKEKFNYGVQLLPSGRGSVPKGNYHNKQPFHPSEPPVLNNKPDVIRLRPTHRVIHGVENMLFNRENPEPVAIERAKQTLHEQERDLLEAIGKLENVLEDDDEAPQNLQNNSGRTRNDGPCRGNIS
ncbi:unnamed protein product [Trifolium pratense]|uniref:Uncharacterized protein n=1 Tax=Trifolium pratense TaxID=57577 RepID=A0ACB0LT78_TRIPR|nr:unnamed protein product [Trifolium pratense]